MKKVLTVSVWHGIIRQSLTDATTILYMQRYRSGHNEAVLKTVCPRGHVGSNPTLCVRKKMINQSSFLLSYNMFCVKVYMVWRSTQEAEGAPLERE